MKPWNDYRIKDDEDAVLRGKFVLTKVVRIKDTANPAKGLATTL